MLSHVQDEVNKTTIAAYLRTRKEIQMPFMSQGSPVRRAGLTLASLEIKTFACPHAQIRLDTGDIKAAAKSVAEETRMWSNTSFLSGMIEFCSYFNDNENDFGYHMYVENTAQLQVGFSSALQQ